MFNPEKSPLPSDDAPWAQTPDEALRSHATTLEGLTSDEAAARKARFGPNSVAMQPGRPPWKILLAQFTETMVLLLSGAAVLSAVLGKFTDAVLIGMIVVVNAVIGFVQEFRAERAAAALAKLSPQRTRVRRDGGVKDVDAADLVPGDIVELRAGDLTPADGRLIEAVDLQVDESLLTGESLSVEKSSVAVAASTALADRTPMVHRGAAVLFGHARVLATATGARTELGRIAALMPASAGRLTPLQARLAVLSRQIAVIVLVIAIAMFLLRLVQASSADRTGGLLVDLLLASVSLAVAAIPEGLPAVVTVTLSMAAWRMAQRKAIVRRLAAVETLGSVDVICSDKTGTLTQNRMEVAELQPARGPEGLREFLAAAVCCNNAAPDASAGSATERAIVEAARKSGLDVAAARSEAPRLAELTFTSARKRMTTLHRRTAAASDAGYEVLTTGAAEQVLSLCTLEEQQHFGPTAAAWAQHGRRVLAVARRDWPHADLSAGPAAVEQSLSLLGLVGIADPVRPEAREAIARCRAAGVRTVMITGDHPHTARFIAEDLGLARPGEGVLSGVDLEALSDADLASAAQHTMVYARVTPEHKLRIVKALQTHDSVVAMTGDGVNDGPALRQADIGVAMGLAGTDVAREASQMVLADDNFATIVSAVEEGRIVYDNIRKFITFLLTTNAAEVVLLFLAVLLGMPLPLLPTHILWINLVTDGLPALALGYEPAEGNVMRRPPRRRNEAVLGAGRGGRLVLFAAVMAIGCLVQFAWWMRASDGVSGDLALATARTMTFVSLSMAQLFFVWSLRADDDFAVAFGPFHNYRLTGAILIGGLVQLAIVYVPAFESLFNTVALSPRELACSVATASLAFFASEAAKLFSVRRRRRPAAAAQEA